MKKTFAINLLDKEGCAARVVEDNTKVTVLKCSAFHLPGYSDGLQGKVRRLGYYFKQALVKNPTVANFLEGVSS